MRVLNLGSTFENFTYEKTWLFKTLYIVAVKIDEKQPPNWHVTSRQGLESYRESVIDEGIQYWNIDPSTPLVSAGDYMTRSRNGLVFLIDIYLLIGEENLGKVYQDLYTQYLETGEKIDEADIQRVILQHSPTEQVQEVSKLIETKMWGR